MDDAARVVGAVLDDDGKLSHLVVEQEDHSVSELLVRPTVDKTISQLFLASPTTGLVTGNHRTWDWQPEPLSGDLLEAGPADEEYWGGIVCPKLTEAGIFGFSGNIQVAAVGAALTERVEIELGVTGDYDGEGDAAFDFSLFQAPVTPVPVTATRRVLFSGVTPWLPEDSDFILTVRITTLAAETLTVQSGGVKLWRLP